MDQKHAMLYPSLAGRPDQPATSFQSNETLSFESPPSYDFAMSSGMPQPSAPTFTSPVPMPSRAYLPPPPPISIQPIHQHLAAESYGNSVAVGAPLPPVIVEQPGREENLKLGPQPSTVTCPECGERRKTRMHHTPNRRTHVFAFILCLVGWCCCACCVPYCMSSCKTGHHYCAKCNRFLGTHKRNAP